MVKTKLGAGCWVLVAGYWVLGAFLSDLSDRRARRAGVVLAGLRQVKVPACPSKL